MKSFAIAVALGLVLVSLSFGSPIQCSTISNYAGLVATGASGCEVGDKLFSNFFITGYLSGSQVSVAQVINEAPEETGLTFQFDLTSIGGGSHDFAIGYLVSTLSGQALIDSAELSMNATTLGVGMVDVVENVCAGGYDITCGEGTKYRLETSVGFIGPGDVSDSVKFRAPVSEAYFSKDINVASGTQGYASISLLTETVDQTGQVPEPATMGLGILGIVLGLGIKRFNRA
jgi:hypothetical protein